MGITKRQDHPEEFFLENSGVISCELRAASFEPYTNKNSVQNISSLLLAYMVVGVSPANKESVWRLTSNSKFLYVLTSGGNSISAFVVANDGGFMSLQTVPGLQEGTNGLAAK